MWANQSRDAKSCVSQARMRYKQMRLYACHCCDWYPGDARMALDSGEDIAWHYCIFCLWDARFCVSTGEDALLIEAIICLALPHFLPGRRKILRLYWADAIIILIQKNVQVCAIVFYTYPHPLFPIQQPFSFHPVRTPHPQYVKNRHKM